MEAEPNISFKEELVNQVETKYDIRHDLAHDNRNSSKYVPIILMTCMVAFGGFIYGWDIGTIAGFVNMESYIEFFGEYNSDSDSYYFTNTRTGLIVGIFNIGGGVGCIFLPKVADKYGRKIGIMATICVYLVGITIQMSSLKGKWIQMVIGRLISGCAIGGIMVLCPLFISESSPTKLRGTLVSFFQLLLTLGIFLGYCTNFGTKRYSGPISWRLTLGLSYAWAFFMILGLFLLPESPRYLAEVGREEEAKLALSKINKLPIDDELIRQEYSLIHEGIMKERATGKGSWKELITGKPRLLYRQIIGSMLFTLAQLTGINYFFYYGTSIFAAIGMNDPFQASIILGLVDFVSTLPGLYLVHKYSRRSLLLSGGAGCLACFIVFAGIGVTKLYPDGVNNAPSAHYGKIMIAFTCLFVFCYACTWALVIYVVVAETYPLRVRSKGMAVATLASWFWVFLISFFTPFITSVIHFRYSFVFIGCLTFSLFFIYFFVPETSGLSLEEIDDLYASGVSARMSSKWMPVSAQITVSEKKSSIIETP